VLEVPPWLRLLVAPPLPLPLLLLLVLLLAPCCSPRADGLSCKVDHSICAFYCLIDLCQAVELQAWVLQLGPCAVHVAGEHAHLVALCCQLGSQTATY
jgi:hypothetical protein